MFAGNPDRQGEAGAGELLFNPWARSAGLHSLNTSSIQGVEAMRLNIAGLGRTEGSEFIVANTRLYEGSDIKLNSFGYSQTVGENSAFGFSVVSVDFGDITLTTEDSPDGIGGATYSPNYTHLGFGYSYTFDNRISVGALFRAVSEGLDNISAFGFAFDAGVQYVSGDREEFKLGISLRNVGNRMKFDGDGLSFQGTEPAGGDFPLTFNQRANEFELPSVLNIGLSYDFYFKEDVYLRALGNFTSNAFSLDQLGVGAEFFFLNKFTLRAAYKSDISSIEGQSVNNLYNGLSFGASVDVPVKAAGNRKIGIDYAYRSTERFDGTHNFAIRINI